MSNRFSRPLADLRSVAVLGAVAASLVLAACGGSGSSTNSVASAEKNREQQFLKLSKCLREHGINVSTPTGGGAIKIQGGIGSISPQTAEAARAACKKYAPAENQNLTPQQRVEREEAVQKFARCMREHGINVHAESKGGQIAIQARAGAGGPNPESPAFQAAQKACQSYLPKPPGGARSGGPGGGPSTSRSGSPSGGGSPKFGLSIGG